MLGSMVKSCCGWTVINFAAKIDVEPFPIRGTLSGEKRGDEQLMPESRDSCGLKP